MVTEAYKHCDVSGLSAAALWFSFVRVSSGRKRLTVKNWLLGTNFLVTDI